MDKGDRIAVIVGLVLLGVLVLGVLLSVAGMMMMAEGERTVLGPAHATPSASPTVSPALTPPRKRPDRPQ